MTRDNAAQMIYNALDAKMVMLENGNYKTSTYDETVTVQVQTGTERVYVLSIPEGSGANANLQKLAGNIYSSYADAQAAATLADSSNDTLGTDYALTQVTQPIYGESTSTKTYDEDMGHKFLSLTTYSDDGVYLVSYTKDTYTAKLSNGREYTKIADDYSDLMGMKVKVLYKKTDNVYGIYASGSSVVATGVVDDISISGTTLKIDGTVYKTDAAFSSTNIYNFNDFATSTDLSTRAGLDKAAQIAAIDNDGDGKIDLLVATPFVAAKVTYKGTDTITLNTP